MGLRGLPLEGVWGGGAFSWGEFCRPVVFVGADNKPKVIPAWEIRESHGKFEKGHGKFEKVIGTWKSHGNFEKVMEISKI